MDSEPSLARSRLDRDGVEVTVSPAARGMRRQLGAAAWAVLEDVLCDATIEASGRLTARTSVRRVAAGLGVSKDTAARALGRLAESGLLLRHDGTRADDGTFTAGAYEVLVDRLDGVTIESSRRRPTPAPGPAEASRRRVGERQHQHQPPLFDLDEGAR